MTDYKVPPRSSYKVSDAPPNSRPPANPLSGTSTKRNYGTIEFTPQAKKKLRAIGQKMVGEFGPLDPKTMLTEKERDAVLKNADVEKLKLLANVALRLIPKEILQREGLIPVRHAGASPSRLPRP